MRDTLHTSSVTVKALATPVAAISTNTTTSGAAIDLALYNNRFRSVLFALATGTVTDGEYAVSLEESDDGVSYSPVPASRVQGSLPTITGSNDNVVYQFGYIPGTARYVRLSIVSTTVTTGATLAGVAVLSDGSLQPVARS